MSQASIQAVVLAAGRSTRFNTGNSKLLQLLCGQEIIAYPTKLLKKLSIPTTFVVGYQAEKIEAVVKKYWESPQFVVQDEPRGTGDALLKTKEHWNSENILVINGDMPLVPEKLIAHVIQSHIEKQSSLTFVTAHHPHPTQNSYGRVVQEESIVRIIEAKDLGDRSHVDPAEPCCINAGIYLFDRQFLQTHLEQLTNDNATHEFYITDLIKCASNQNIPIETVKASFDHVRGINTLKELWIAEQIKRSELISYWMERGVRFDVAQAAHIDIDVSIGTGTSIGAGTHLLRGTTIGNYCRIDPFCIVENATIGNELRLKAHSVITDATVEHNATIGPFAHICKSTIKSDACVGNFVEIKRSIVGAKSKAKHLTYLGDTRIGDGANIGAGTITCNYDGTEKYTTTIENGAFVGSNNTLVAPVIIQKGAYTAAGSTITEDVPQDALAIARCRQTIKEGYAQRIKKTEKHAHDDVFIAAKESDTIVERS